MPSICLFCLNTGVTILTSDKTDFISLLSLYSLIFCRTGSWLLHRLFSGCGEWGLLSSCGVQAPHSGGFACCRTVSRLQWLGLLGSGAQSQQLWYMGFVVMQHVGSSRIRDQTRVSGKGRILDQGSSPPRLLNINRIRDSSNVSVKGSYFQGEYWKKSHGTQWPGCDLIS